MSFSDAVERYKAQLLFTALLAGGLYYPVLGAMVLKWYTDPNYSHGFIVPFISGYVLFRQYGSLKGKPVVPDNRGFLLMAAGLVLFAAARLGSESFGEGISFIVVMAGLVSGLFGGKVLGAVRFPLGYLVFMVPLPYTLYDAVAFPLKLFIAASSVSLLKAAGIVVWREGNIIMFPNAIFEVADACSGIRSLVSLMALGVAFAYFTQKTTVKRVVLALSAVPIAVFANGLRVVVTGVLAQYWGARAAEGFFHAFAGIAVFGVAVALLMAAGALVKRM